MRRGVIGESDDGGRHAGAAADGCGGGAIVCTLANVNDEDDHADHPRCWWSRTLAFGLVARKFGHRFLGAVIVNQRLAGGSCGDGSSGGDVVERPRQAQIVSSGDSVGEVDTGAGCVARAQGGCGFDVAGVQDACARTRCCLIFCWSID
jgi:hypothetical protein